MSQSQTKTSRIRIKDIAKHLSLSLCTVSKILNNHADLVKDSPDTIARVRKAADKLGYYPNEIAQSLASGRTRTIGLCLADLAAAMFGEFAGAFQKKATANGFMTFICTAGDDPAAEVAEVKALMSRWVDALVISPIGSEVADSLAKAVERGCRMVFFDRPLPGVDASEVMVNNREAMRILTQKCLAMGHRRIGVIMGNPGDTSLIERLAGVEDAVAGTGASLAVSDGNETTSESGGRIGMAQLLRQHHPPTLALTLGSPLTIGALAELQANGLALGKDVSMAGFDDFPGAELLSPPLTVVNQPVRKMAEACLELACRDGRAPAEKVLFKAEIAWRGSVVKIKGGA